MEEPWYNISVLRKTIEEELEWDLLNVDWWLEHLPNKFLGLQPYIELMMNKYGVDNPKNAVITNELRERHKTYYLKEHNKYKK